MEEVQVTVSDLGLFISLIGAWSGLLLDEAVPGEGPAGAAAGAPVDDRFSCSAVRFARQVCGSVTVSRFNSMPRTLSASGSSSGASREMDAGCLPMRSNSASRSTSSRASAANSPQRRPWKRDGRTGRA